MPLITVCYITELRQVENDLRDKFVYEAFSLIHCLVELGDLARPGVVHIVGDQVKISCNLVYQVGAGGFAVGSN